MKYNCNVIRDLLPLYADKISCADTNQLIESHFEECSECKKRYEEMKKSFTEEELVGENNAKETKKITSYAKKIKRRRMTIIAVVAMLFILLLSSFLSYVQFGVANPIRSGIGVLQILATDKAYVEISSQPRVVLAQPEEYPWDLFLSVMEQEGYTYLEEERMGAMCVFEKDGNKEQVIFRVNGYYAQWTWVE